MTRRTQDGEARFIRRYRPEDGPEVVRVIKSIYDAYNFLMDFEEFDLDLAHIVRASYALKLNHGRHRPADPVFLSPGDWRRVIRAFGSRGAS